MSRGEKKTYTISELAHEFGISTRTIRYYEEVGLINSHREKDTLPRTYTSRDRTRLKLALRGKRFGFSLAEIKEMLDLYDVDPTEKEQLRRAIELGDKRIAEIDEMIRELEETKQEMLEFRQKFLEILREKEEWEAKDQS
ncbi:MAG TPA: MerR family DNA-binding transcriptional regulator [Clostridia bacterium]|nr:MerR family DNA-binding transcriptional regulator [Clostridia bacterium]